jgi:hypothetical protein
MKPLFCLMLIVTASTIFDPGAYGQVAVTDLRSSNGISSAENSVPKNVSGTIDRNDVNSKAVKNFVRSYKNVSNEIWFDIQDGFVAKFTLTDIVYLVYYDRKGYWLHTIRTYNESKLPQDIRHLVKSSYYDYTIMVVQELEKPLNTLTYIIHMEGKTNWINLRVCNGEMDEWQEFIKSK